VLQPYSDVSMFNTKNKGWTMMSRMWLCSGTSAPCEVLCRQDQMGGVLMEWLLQQPQGLFLTASNTLPMPIP